MTWYQLHNSLPDDGMMDINLTVVEGYYSIPLLFIQFRILTTPY